MKKYNKFLLKRTNVLDISILCSQLSLMLNTGIPLFKAFEILEIQYNKSRLKRALKTVKENVIKGNTLYESMKKVKDIFPQFMIETIKIGEEAGRLEEILGKLSSYYKKQYNIMCAIKNALAYPLLILITSIIVMVYLMTRIIPQFVDIILSQGGEVPFLTKIVIYGCEFLIHHHVKICITMILITILLWKFSKNYQVKKTLESIKIKIPPLKKIYTNLIIFKICSSMSILIKSGVNVVKALKITGGLLENSIMNERVEQCVTCMEQGESMYGALNRLQIDDSIFLSLIKTGETTGKMEEIFSSLEELFENDINRYFKRLTKVIEPVVIIFLALFVGIFVMAALMPVFSIMDTTL
ncbi:type II secretion system F family protein [Clostridium sp.]|uniref:type II secretion system F family protein n=1 Tax=Clostridium sp. TaxID=1506 RepID=UPI002FDD3C43